MTLISKETGLLPFLVVQAGPQPSEPGLKIQTLTAERFYILQEPAWALDG